MTEAPDPPPRPPGRGPDPVPLAGGAAALLWVAFCVLWFDVAASWRPAALLALSPLALLAASLLAALAWLRGRWGTLAGPPLGAAAPALVLVLALASFFRLPFVARGAGAVTPDGALSGIVALRVRGQRAPGVRAPRALQREPEVAPRGGPRRSSSIRPAPSPSRRSCSTCSSSRWSASPHSCRGRRAALVAGLYAAFAPPFVTRYSLSNDGNYVEVLALGTWASASRSAGERRGSRRAARLRRRPAPGPRLLVPHPGRDPPGRGGAVRSWRMDLRSALRALSPPLAAGWVLGNAPGSCGTSPTGGSPSATCCRGGPRVSGRHGTGGSAGRAPAA